MKSFYTVAIIGVVGVPARYGGFETLAEQLGSSINSDQMRFVFYCQKSAYQKNERLGAFRGHPCVYLPIKANGIYSLFYDVVALFHALFIRRVDSFLMLGYSGAWALPILKLISPKSLVVTNIDGMEWRRSKFSKGARVFLRFLESCATRFSTRIVVDNSALAKIAKDIHPYIDPYVIAYGGDHTLPKCASASVTAPKSGYAFALSRIEPENNVELIIESCIKANQSLVYVGNWNSNSYGKRLKARFSDQTHIHLMDAIYDVDRLFELRRNARCYLHGHSVGGTNPSLVEALYHTNRIFAYDCSFNRATLNGAGAYFNNATRLAELLVSDDQGFIAVDELSSLQREYRWESIAGKYRSVVCP